MGPGRHGAASVLALAVLTGVACGAENEPAQGRDTAPSVAIDPERWPAVRSPRVKDAATIEREVDALLSSLTLEEKVAQIIQPDISTVTPDDVRRYRFGSILNGGNSGVRGNDRAPAPEWLALADEFHAAAMAAPEGRPAIPLLWGIDAVHGHNNIIGATYFPHNIGLGATGNPELIRQIGEITAREVRVTGQDWTFAPTLAVAQDVRWGRSYESYAERPEIVAAYAGAMVRGLQGEPDSEDFLRDDHVIATAKHFLGDGGTAKGRDQGDNRASESELREIHGAGYPVAIDAGVQTVMASLSSWQGQKLHGHKALLTDVLKERMSFDGFIVGDWNGHGQLPGCSNASCPAAINAGLDMFMAPEHWRELYDNTLAQVRAGEIAQARLDDAVRRILRVKMRAGLFAAGKPSSRPLAGKWNVLGAPEHRAVARRAVRESLVLLKNENRLLPLKPRARVLVAGDGANSLSKQNGGWTITWQGTGVPNEQFRNAETIFDGIRTTVAAAGGIAVLSEDGSFEQRPDIAIVVFGEEPYAEFQGDIETLDYQPGNSRDLTMLRKLRAAGIPVVSVFLSGRPLWVNPELNASNAFVAAWLPGGEGGGIADVLFASADGRVRHDFTGRLSFRWPRVPDPGTDDAPLFPFGFGLTYADDGALPVLPENIASRSEEGTSTRTLFAAGKPGAGWRLVVTDVQGTRELNAHVGSAPGSVLQVTPVDRAAQEDARLLTWSGRGAATFAIRSSAPVDLLPAANEQRALVFDYRVHAAPTAPVMLALDCGEKCGAHLPINDQLSAAGAGEWQTFRVLLRCLERQGADMRRVHAPLTLTTSGTLQLAIANVRLESGEREPACR